MNIVRMIEKAGGIVTYQELRSLGISRQLVSYYLRKGELVRISRGVYAVPELREPFLLAKYISPGYVSFYSALYYHKLADAPPSVIILATRGRSGKIEKMGFEFQEIAVGRRFCGYVDEERVRMATRAKTLYDSFRRPDLGGGYPLLLKAVYEARLREEEWEEFLGYIRKFDKPAFWQRVGYMLSLLENVPDFVTDFLRSRVRGYVYLDRTKKGGKLVKEWKVVDNIGREVLLSWMKG